MTQSQKTHMLAVLKGASTSTSPAPDEEEEGISYETLMKRLYDRADDDSD
jgi:hypothetical protein